MAQAAQANSPQPITVQQAAAEITALINASPRTPWPSEIEAVISKVAGFAPDARQDETLADDRATWRKLVIEAEGTLRAKDLLVGDPRLPAAEAISDAAYERLHASRRRSGSGRPAASAIFHSLPICSFIRCGRGTA